ncbi:hypothetical protein [Paraliobacillus sediminis]|uniref:hypothetical protein n=1 Tax=Paraliobacillus sediminis TaxID=1885916 RepID=UPI000E3E000F|nr:hypothetical protein [Paraliobacillus sediminis]
MSVDFIHIGMMKTATTYMQSIWMKDEAYSLSWQGNMKLLNSLRKLVSQDQFNSNLILDIRTDIPKEKKQKTVISNEGFSTAYLNQLHLQEKIPQFIDLTSQNLGRLAHATPNLLIGIRDPVSWLKSMYVQSIKEGGYGSAQEFVDKQFLFIRHSLDLEYIVNCYKRYFNNILILPYEILKTDEDLFWNVISDVFDVPVPNERIVNPINSSLDLKRTFLLSKLNEMSSLLVNTINISTDYKNSQEKLKLMQNHKNNEKWVHRRFVEFANVDQIDNMYNLFQISNPPDDFLEFTITDELKGIIKNKFIKFIRENTIPEFADDYEKKLLEHLNK